MTDSTKKCVTAIANCSKHSDTAGECKSCKAGFYLATDKKSCKANIANCYEAKGGAEATKCKTCNTKYTLKTADETCQAITAANCTTSPADKPAECTSCEAGYFIKTGETTCTKITVANCSSSNISKDAAKCDTCLTGFHKKDDKSACTAMAGCSDAFYKTTLQCYQCDISNSYYATDVKGTAEITDLTPKRWEQVCTKAAKIIATTIVALTMIANF